MMHEEGLSKQERLYLKQSIDLLFSAGSKGFAAWPLRGIFRLTDRTEGEPAVEMLISVPKRCFKRAVKRNRVKRQVRDAFRRHKGELTVPEGKKGLLAFIWLDNKLHDSATVEDHVQTILQHFSHHQP